MQAYPVSSNSSQPDSSSPAAEARRWEDLLYQAVTIAAILMLLGSVWVF